MNEGIPQIENGNEYEEENNQQKENEDNFDKNSNNNLAGNKNINNINNDIRMKNNAINNLSNENKSEKDNDNDLNITNKKDTNLIEEKKNINQNQKGITNDNQNFNKANLNKNIKECLSFPNSSVSTPNKIEEEKYFYNDKINYTYKPKKIESVQQKPIIYNNNNCKNITYELSKYNYSKSKRTRDNYSPLQGNIIHDKSELELISNKIHGKKYKIIFNLLYKASQDKDISSAFHQKCDSNQTTLILIETNKGYRFGGFTKRTWKGKGNEKFDNDAFIFSLNKKKIYNVIKGKNAIGCYPNCGPVFCGAFKIYDNAFSKGGCSFAKGLNFETLEDFELTNGEENFGVKEIEVYEIKIA
jgi:hypothetical protein